MSTFPSSTPGGATPGDRHGADARRIRHPLAAAGVPYAPALASVLQEPRVQVRTLFPAASILPGTLAPEACEVVVEPHVPVQLAQTLGSLRRGAQDLSYRALSRADGAERIWLTARTPFHEFPAVLYTERLAQPAELPENLAALHRLLMRPVRIRLWVSYTAADQQMQARADLQALAQEMTYWLGLHDPAEQFSTLSSFESLPPRIQQAWRQNPGLRLSASGQLDRQMLNAIVEQRITQTEAFRTLGWVLRKYGSLAPSTSLGHQPEGMRVYPSARTLATIPTWDWHRAGVDKSRYDAVYAYARSAESLKNIAAEGDIAQLARSLHTVRGVGPWSISEALQRVCGHPDAISVGDYHLAHAVGELFTGKRTDDAGMLTLLAPYSPHRQRLVRLMHASGFSKQRYGARMTIEDHRDR
ncbi:3-methyladenine DNA glycosylase [uncultured Rothia sp.]|uniref:DNA-3-methyladenine glycosylase family protein n=1 Tax=uncultured Rothia sp. TaxID=316088 RepID=UPI0028E54549|nr:3-methyladenine DNA glycosylase [uncultured Rothia sp.]